MKWGSPNAPANLLKENGRMLILDKRDYAGAEAPDHYCPLFEKLKGINEDAVCIKKNPLYHNG